MSTICLQTTRKVSFNKSRRGAQKVLNWPHATTPKSLSILPEKLAQAGFIHHPLENEPDNVMCFLCKVEVKDWKAGDDPLERHLEINQHCGFAIMTLQITLDWMNIDELKWEDHSEEDRPNSNRMKQARLDSFSVGWPHEDNLDMPTVQQLAEVGFYFRPQNDEDEADNCFCPYCARQVSSWEAGDDPMALHRRKAGLNCPFFFPVAIAEPKIQPAPVVAARRASKKIQELAPYVDVDAPVPSLSRSKGRKQIASAAVLIEESEVANVSQIIIDLPSTSVKRVTKTRAKKASTIIDAGSTSVLESSLDALEPEVVPEVAQVQELSLENEQESSGELLNTAPSTRNSTTQSKTGKGKKSKKNSVAVEIISEPLPIEEVSEMDLVIEPVAVEEELLVEEELVVESAAAKKEKKGKGRAKKSSLALVDSMEINHQLPPLQESAPEIVSAPPVVEKDLEPVPVESIEQPSTIEEDIVMEEEAIPAVLEVLTPAPVKKVKKVKSKKMIPETISTTPISKPAAQPFLPMSIVPFPQYSANPNPFSTITLPPPTEDELNLTLEEWYDLCGKRQITAYTLESEKAESEFEGKYEEAFETLDRIRIAALRRDERKGIRV